VHVSYQSSQFSRAMLRRWWLLAQHPGDYVGLSGPVSLDEEGPGRITPEVMEGLLRFYLNYELDSVKRLRVAEERICGHLAAVSRFLTVSHFCTELKRPWCNSKLKKMPISCARRSCFDLLMSFTRAPLTETLQVWVLRVTLCFPVD
jgi:hypothetical protein